jgi:hypothetical protein
MPQTQIKGGSLHLDIGMIKTVVIAITIAAGIVVVFCNALIPYLQRRIDDQQQTAYKKELRGQLIALHRPYLEVSAYVESIQGNDLSIRYGIRNIGRLQAENIRVLRCQALKDDATFLKRKAGRC